MSDTAQYALRNYVHGPREEGATFLAQFATKEGMNTQLLTLTLGPVELWAFTTTAEDVNIRNQLYRKIGPKETRRVLARIFPSGSATRYLSEKLSEMKEETGFIDEEMRSGVINSLIKDILERYSADPNFSFI